MVTRAHSGRRRLAALLASAALAIPAVVVGAAGTAPAFAAPIPCPKVVAPPMDRPPRPSPPAADPAHFAVGGEQLATPGLVVPPGVKSPPGNTAISWLVADLDTGEVLGACGAHEYATPASVQKLLLAATFVDKLDPRRVITITHDDVDIPSDSSAVGLIEGGHYSIETLWLGLLLQSGNDAANTLARLGGGSAALGVEAMNAEALRLGALQTHAVTPSGYDGPGQFTSAYDLALIARACFASETFRRYELTEFTQIPAQPPKYPKGYQIQNENQLIYEYPGALGGKTGFTSLARHTYVGLAERNGRRLVVTLLGAEPHPQRGWQQGASLLDWGFGLPSGASVGRLVDPGELLASPTPQESPSVIPVAAPAAHRGWATVTTLLGSAAAAATGFVVLTGLVRRSRRARRG
jgi:D-alanyl-D-alanine carboxypeptidase (penicillin-binding protein 5/6)